MGGNATLGSHRYGAPVVVNIGRGHYGLRLDAADPLVLLAVLGCDDVDG